MQEVQGQRCKGCEGYKGACTQGCKGSRSGRVQGVLRLKSARGPRLPSHLVKLSQAIFKNFTFTIMLFILQLPSASVTWSWSTRVLISTFPALMVANSSWTFCSSNLSSASFRRPSRIVFSTADVKFLQKYKKALSWVFFLSKGHEDFFGDSSQYSQQSGGVPMLQHNSVKIDERYWRYCQVLTFSFKVYHYFLEKAGVYLCAQWKTIAIDFFLAWSSTH